MPRASSPLGHTEGELVADGTAAFTITAAGATANIVGRQRLIPPADDMPQVIYLGEETGEAALLEALQSGEVGNRDASWASDGALVVAALDEAVEWGGFALAACLYEKINYLTDNRRIGYQDWRADEAVFLTRAAQWRP